MSEYDGSLDHASNVVPVPDKSSEKVKTTPTFPNKLHHTQSRSSSPDSDSDSRFPWMLPNDAYSDGEESDEYEAERVDRQKQEKSSAKSISTVSASHISSKHEHRDIHPKKVKSSSRSKNPSSNSPKTSTKDFGRKKTKNESNKHSKRMDTASSKRSINPKKQQANKIKERVRARNQTKSTLLKSFPQGRGFDVEVPGRKLSRARTSIPQLKYRVEAKWIELESLIRNFVHRTLRNPRAPFIAFKVDQDSGKFTEITMENDMKTWKAAANMTEDLIHARTTPIRNSFSGDAFSRKITSMALQGLYDEDSLWQYKPSNPGPDTFEITDYPHIYKGKHLYVHTEYPTSEPSVTVPPVSKVHKLFADSMVANFPYQFTGACNNVCERNTSEHAYTKILSNVHILTAHHYEAPKTRDQLYKVILYSDGNSDSFTIRIW